MFFLGFFLGRYKFVIDIQVQCVVIMKQWSREKNWCTVIVILINMLSSVYQSLCSLSASSFYFVRDIQ